MEEEMKLARAETKPDGYMSLMTRLLAVAVVLMAFSLSLGAAAPQKSFSSAEEAVKAAVAAARNNDDKEMLAIFGANAKEILFSGDAVADKERRGRFVAAYDEKNRLATQKEDTILIVGQQEWPFPIPLVKKGNVWVFDTAQGKEEILNRRVGENELNASMPSGSTRLKTATGTGSSSMHRSSSVIRAKAMDCTGTQSQASRKVRWVRSWLGQGAKDIKANFRQPRFLTTAITTNC
jgi:Protein of unknown function (DUF2950)